MDISKRLKSVVNLVDKNSIPVDVGTDHCYVPIALIESGKCKEAIATELNSGPYKIAEQNIKAKGLSNNIDLRLGFGLDPIKPGEVDTIIISGMGGNTIVEILKGAPKVVEKAHSFVFQPMTAEDELRRFLVKSNFKITEEQIVKEGHKFYQVIKSTHGFMQVEQDVFYEIGFVLPYKKDPVYKSFLLTKIHKYSIILNNLKRASSSNVKKKQIIGDKLTKLKEVLKWQ